MLGGQGKELEGKGDRLPIPLSLTRIPRRYYKMALFEKKKRRCSRRYIAWHFATFSSRVAGSALLAFRSFRLIFVRKALQDYETFDTALFHGKDCNWRLNCLDARLYALFPGADIAIQFQTVQRENSSSISSFLLYI